jgi:HAMP domain-containing protein
MSEEINFINTGYDKQQYEELVNTDFSQLISPPLPQEILEEEPNVSDFFQMYNDMFYQIPQTGNNSHETLILQSGVYINFQANNEEIEALQNEISQLRQQLLEEQKKNIELQTGENISLDNQSTSIGSNSSTTNTY